MFKEYPSMTLFLQNIDHRDKNEKITTSVLQKMYNDLENKTSLATPKTSIREPKIIGIEDTCNNIFLKVTSLLNFWYAAINADIPVYVVAYKGPKNIDTLINNLDSSVNECGIAGVLIIESGFYVTKKFTAEGTSGLYAFVADLSVYLSSIVGIASSSLYNHADIKFR